ncbi:MAG: hypothetical protein HY006_00735 [Candidatus Sungbacteria bacterium]|nr:hypothetical protein [Candidatus Sungbacteria bacterium]
MNLGSKIAVVRVWEGGISTTPNYSAVYFALRNTNLGGGESEGGAGIHFPHTLFLPAPSERLVFGARSAPSVPFKIGSDFVKQTHQYQTFRFLPDRFGRAKRGKVWKHWLAAHGAARQAQVRNPLRF